MNGDFAKCACQHCGVHIEFPATEAGITTACPQCGQHTLLMTEEAPQTSDAAPSVDVLSGLSGSMRKPKISPFYQLGMLLVTVVMLLLPVLYVAIIGCLTWGVVWYARNFTSLLHSFRGGMYLYLFKLALYIGPIFAGGIAVLFMFKPLFARMPKGASPLALNPEVETTLYAYIARICAMVGAPMPTRIDLDCQLNASASFRRGAMSMAGNDLVLTLGLPLVAGLNTRELAGVIAHEFGHFTQGFGMRLSYVTRRINGWFARVAYARDAWDVWLQTMAWECQEWWLCMIIGCAQFAVWCSRLVLIGLMWIGHGVSCFFSRQMEYDADSYRIQLAGSATFESSTIRFAVLAESLHRSYKDIRTTWNIGKELPVDFSEYLLHKESKLPPEHRQRIENVVGFDKTTLFSTHPSPADRIRKARQADEPGVYQTEVPARDLFANFDVISKQVTRLHYSDDLGIEYEPFMLKPIRK